MCTKFRHGWHWKTHRWIDFSSVWQKFNIIPTHSDMRMDSNCNHILHGALIWHLICLVGGGPMCMSSRGRTSNHDTRGHIIRLRAANWFTCSINRPVSRRSYIDSFVHESVIRTVKRVIRSTQYCRVIIRYDSAHGHALGNAWLAHIWECHHEISIPALLVKCHHS